MLHDSVKFLITDDIYIRDSKDILFCDITSLCIAKE